VLSEAERNQVEQDLHEMENDWVTAYETREFTALDRIFADDFIYTVDDGTLYGKEAFIRLAEQNRIAYDSVTLEDVAVRWYGDVAVVTGQVRNFWQDESGTAQTSGGRWTNVFVARNGRWQCVVGHSTDVE
jgi:ketosteroid isomerase-like protein